MKRSAVVLAAVGTLALTATASTGAAEARGFGPGIAGGVLAGAAIAGAASTAYAWGPGYEDYGPGYYYGGPAPYGYAYGGYYGDQSKHGGQPYYGR